MRFRLFFYLCFHIALSGYAQQQCLFSEIRPPYKSISPLVLNLTAAANAEGFSSTLVWDSITQLGVPVVETDSLYDDYVWITLLYRTAAANVTVSFDMFGIYSEYRMGDRKMHRLQSTDIYYRSYMVPNDICFSYRFRITDTITKTVSTCTDPLNGNRIPTGKVQPYSYSVLDVRPDKPPLNHKKGSSCVHQLDTLLFESNILGNTRNVYLSLPKGYDAQKPDGYQTIFLFDSFIYLNRVEVPTILEHLYAEGKIEPTIAVFIDNPTRMSRKTELPLNWNFKDAIVSELVPLIKQKYAVTNEPSKTIIGGMSYGGLAAAFIGWHHPEIFGKVLSQSGSFWRDSALTDGFGNEVRNDWLITEVLKNPHKNITWYLDWGLQEDMVLGANRKFVRVLRQKNYSLLFTEFNGWHDWSNSRKTFPDGLLFLTKH